MAAGGHGTASATGGGFRLAVDDDELASCVGCGLCLPHCPTYRVTRDEVASPRGRIALMRQVHLEGAPLDDAFVSAMDACVQCRGCETACPSGVPFGHLMEGTREAVVAARPEVVPRWQRLAFRGLGHHRALLVGSSVLGAVQRIPGASRVLHRVLPAGVRAGLPAPPLPVRRAPLQPTPPGSAARTPVILFTGCVMDAWQRDVHLATQRVLEAAGAAVRFPAPVRGGGCCGALHVHAGLVDDATAMVPALVRSLAGTEPIVVNSAGCGARLLDIPELAPRVVDVHTWLAGRLDALPRPPEGAQRPRVVVQDPCHLRHVQRTHLAVRRVLAPYADLAELDDDGLCCGAGGAYAALHPGIAGEIRARKLAAIGRAGGDQALVVSANPGCALHLAAAGARVVHPLEVVDAVLAGRSPETAR
jgi:glycolate oxidase iron-sulfur subunit